MALLCFILFVGGVAGLYLTVLRVNEDSLPGSALSISVGILFIIMCGVATFKFSWLGFSKLIDTRFIDQKIKIYEEENEKIEKDVDFIVAKYMEHENETFDMSEVGSTTVLVQMYPELKSNELVSKQIDIYNENNKKIKKLKLEKVENQKAKFYLYLGGLSEW